MKSIFLLCILCVYIPVSASDSEPLSVTVVFPPEISQVGGLDAAAWTLGFYDHLVESRGLVPFTALRKIMEEKGFWVMGKTTTATKVKIARALKADRLAYVVEEDQEAVLHIVSCRDLSLSILPLPEPQTRISSEWWQDIAATLELPYSEEKGISADFYGVWAEAYLRLEEDDTKQAMTQLLRHPLSGWLFFSEYTDLYGDPFAEVESVEELLGWRKILLDKGLYGYALRVSEQVIIKRHHPEDLLIQAEIYLDLGREKEACEQWRAAGRYGFQASARLREQCDESPEN